MKYLLIRALSLIAHYFLEFELDVNFHITLNHVISMLLSVYMRWNIFYSSSVD